MIKRFYLANGELVAPLSASADDIAVDTSIATLLGTMTVGDYCYLSIEDGCTVEVVQIRRDYTGFPVRRAQAGTDRTTFPKGAKIVYRLTTAEILDVVEPKPYNIYASGYGTAKVTGGGGTWDIGLTPINIEPVGGIDVYYPEGYDVVLTDPVGAFGCCDGSVTGAPDIEGPFFYFTSQLYPQEVFEVMTPNPKDNNGNAIPPFGFGDGFTWWLLTQPTITGDYVLKNVEILDFELYGGSASYSSTDGYFANSVGIGDWNIYGGAEDFTVPADDWISTDCYVLEMQLFGNAVEYDRYLDPTYISPTVAVTGMELI